MEPCQSQVFRTDAHSGAGPVYWATARMEAAEAIVQTQLECPELLCTLHGSAMS